MSVNVQAGDQYTIQRKMFGGIGQSFRVFDASGALVGFCKQKGFKLKEDIRVYTDETKSEELLVIRARKMQDFSGTYDVTLPTGEALGSLRRKGLKSSFIRDEWLIFDEQEQEIAKIREKGGILAPLRKMNDFVSFLSPQTYEVFRLSDDALLATFKEPFSVMRYRLGVRFGEQDERLDELMLLGAACVLAVIEESQGD